MLEQNCFSIGYLKSPCKICNLIKANNLMNKYHSLRFRLTPTRRTWRSSWWRRRRPSSRATGGTSTTSAPSASSRTPTAPSRRYVCARRVGAGFTQPHSIHPFAGRHDAGGALQGAERAEDDGEAGGGRGDGRRAGRQPEELERPHRQTQHGEHIRK